MLTYPHFNPVALQIGFVRIYWYGIMYILGFAAAWWLALYRAKKNFISASSSASFTAAEIGDFIFYCALGVVVGGRLGYILFYYIWNDFAGLVADPWVVFRTWEGGMSFHGGLLGVLIGVLWFAKRYRKNFLAIADFVAPLVPIGLFFGRIGNFINGELWGRVTTVPWAMIFPNGGAESRHPSQLYEAGLEGVALFVFLWWYSATPKPRGKVAAWFLIGYGIVRIFCEFLRQPDPIGFIAFGWVTTGQLLSLPMIAIGLWLLFRRA